LHNPPGRGLATGCWFDKNGTLVVADHGNRGISRWNDSLFTRTVVVDRFEEALQQPERSRVGAEWRPLFHRSVVRTARAQRRLGEGAQFNGVFRLSAAVSSAW
jgi:hypothetical protein